MNYLYCDKDIIYDIKTQSKNTEVVVSWKPVRQLAVNTVNIS